MKILDKKDRAYRALLAALFLFYLYIAAQIPYMHDDWDWGLPIGLEQFLHASVNSRYAGNACVVLLTRAPLLKDLVMALAFALLPAAELRLVSRLGGFEARTVTGLLAANALFLLMPAEIWRQTCGWVSGFCNFVLSALLLLGCHCLLFGEERERRGLRLCGVFAYGLLMQLFLENVAIYSVGLSLGLLALRGIREKKLDRSLLALFLGNLLGLLLVFSSGVFVLLFREGQAIDATRELVANDHVGLLPYLLRCLLYYVKYFPALWGHNSVLCCAVLGLLFLLAGKRRLRVGLANGAFALYFLYTALYGELRLSTDKRSLYLAVALNFAYFCLVALECWLLFSGRLRARLLGCWLSAPLVLLPLAITTMEGGRLFFTPYVLQSVFTLLLFATLTRGASPRRALRLALAALLLGSCLRLGLAYHEIGTAYRERLALLRIEEGAITLPELPHSELLWYADPQTYTRRGYFRAYYGVSDALELSFASGMPVMPW